MMTTAELLTTAVTLLKRAQRMAKSAAHPSARRVIATVVVQVLDVHLELRRQPALPRARGLVLRAILAAESERLDRIEYGTPLRSTPAGSNRPARRQRATNLS